MPRDLGDDILDVYDVDNFLALGRWLHPHIGTGLVDSRRWPCRQMPVIDVRATVPPRAQRLGRVFDVVVFLEARLQPLRICTRFFDRRLAVMSIFWKRRAKARSFSKRCRRIPDSGGTDAFQFAEASIGLIRFEHPDTDRKPHLPR